MASITGSNFLKISISPFFTGKQNVNRQETYLSSSICLFISCSNNSLSVLTKRTILALTPGILGKARPLKNKSRNKSIN